MHSYPNASTIALPGEKTVSLYAPQRFNLRLEDGRVAGVEVGITEVPEVLAQHWYTKAHGAVIQGVAEAAAAEAAAAEAAARAAQEENLTDEEKAVRAAEAAAAAAAAPPAAKPKNGKKGG